MSKQLSEEDIAQLTEQAQKLAEELQKAKQTVYDNLARTIESHLTQRFSTRKVKESQWLEALRRYLGSLSSYNYLTNEYPLGVPDAQKSSNNRPEVNITRRKCETAVAQILAYQFAAGDKNWDLRPPQVPEQFDPVEMAQIQQLMQMQMAPDEITTWKIEQMEAEMANHLELSNYGVEIRKAAKDWAILGTGIVKCPTNSTKVKKTYVRSQTSDGKYIRVPKLAPISTPSVYRVDPWYFFPDDSVTDIDKAEDTIEVHPLSKSELRELMYNPAFLADQIAPALEEPPTPYMNSPFNDPAYLTQGINLLKDRYLVLEYHGPVKRSDLEILGRTPAVDNGEDEFMAEIWVVNHRVIRFEFSNLEGCYRCPYAVVPWLQDPASIFGFGIPMEVRDQQRVINETYHMMLDNAGISAGPQVIIDTTLIQQVEGGLECTPFKVWVAKEYGTDTSKAIQFFVPPNNYEGLQAVFLLANQLADSESGVNDMLPNGPSGAGDSATGMAIMQQNASSPLFYKSEQWDDKITRTIIQMLLDWEMQYNENDLIKGTYDVDVRTSTANLQSSLNQQKIEKMSMEIAQGSPIGEWIKMDEWNQLRLADARLPYKQVVKSPEELARERAQRPPPPPDPNLLKAQAAMEKVQVDKARVELENRRLDVEAQQKHDEAVMQYQAQLRTDDVREKEANASVIKAQFDFQTQMAVLASQDEQHRQQLVSKINIEQMKDQTTRFLGGVDAALKTRDQKLTEQELQVKKQEGTGI